MIYFWYVLLIFYELDKCINDVKDFFIINSLFYFVYLSKVCIVGFFMEKENVIELYCEKVE